MQPSPMTIPKHIEAERRLIGGILALNSNYDELPEEFRLSGSHFSDRVLGQTWDWMVKCLERGMSVDADMLAPAMRKLTTLDENDPKYLPPEDAESYLDTLTAAAGVITMKKVVIDSAKVVRNYALWREAQNVGQELVDVASEATPDQDPAEMIGEKVDRLVRIQSTGIVSGHMSLANAIKGAIEKTEQAQLGKVGISTGLHCLDRRIGGLQKGSVHILAGATSMGKAQPLDAKILTSSGWVTMGELKVGDALASVNGLSSQVTGIFPQGERQIYRITFSDGRSTECCAEHLWRVRLHKWRGYRVVSTEKLMAMLECKSHRNRLSIELVSGDFGHDQAVPVDPYVLGALIGNGNLIDQFRFSSNDEETVSRLRDCLPAGTEAVFIDRFDYRIRGIRKAEGAGGRDASKALVLAIEGLGLRGTRSHDKFIPDIYKTANRHVRGELLAGLLDTDGWTEKLGSIRYSTSSRKLAEDVVDLVRSLGGMCSIKEKTPFYTYKGERKQGRPHFICKIRHQDGDSLFRLPRKSYRAVRTLRTIRLSISSIEPSRIAEAQCISVSHPDRTYVTDDYIVTHNTALALNMARSAAEVCLKEGYGSVIYASYEMPAEQLAQRIIANEVSLTIDKQVAQRLSPHEHERRMWDMQQAYAKLERLPLHLGGRMPKNIQAFTSYAKRVHREEGGLRLIAVDYLQLMNGQSRERVQEIAEISRGLKALAIDLDVPVLALSQLSREVDKREDNRPQMSDLREGGSIEHDADVVMFAFRRDYYLRRKEPQANDPKYTEWCELMKQFAGKAELITAKCRQGEIGSDMLEYEGQYFLFKEPNYQPSYQSNHHPKGR